MCEFFGWVQGSDMPRIYIHLSGRDVDEATLRVYGLVKEDERQPKLTPVQCPRCSMLNDGESRYCSRCGLPLAKDAQVDVVAEEMLIKELHNAILNDDLFREVLVRLRPFITTVLRKEIEKRKESWGK